METVGQSHDKIVCEMAIFTQCQALNDTSALLNAVQTHKPLESWIGKKVMSFTH